MKRLLFWRAFFHRKIQKNETEKIAKNQNEGGRYSLNYIFGEIVVGVKNRKDKKRRKSCKK